MRFPRFLGRGAFGRAVRLLGRFVTAPFIDFRVFVRVQVDRVSRPPLIASLRPDLPLLGFAPPHGIDAHQRAVLTLRYRHASEPSALLPDQQAPALHGFTVE